MARLEYEDLAKVRKYCTQQLRVHRETYLVLKFADGARGRIVEFVKVLLHGRNHRRRT